MYSQFYHKSLFLIERYFIVQRILINSMTTHEINDFRQFCLVIAIFFAVRLNKAKLPEWVDWILTAYVVFHILIHLILTVRILIC